MPGSIPIESRAVTRLVAVCVALALCAVSNAGALTLSCDVDEYSAWDEDRCLMAFVEGHTSFCSVGLMELAVRPELFVGANVYTVGYYDSRNAWDIIVFRPQAIEGPYLPGEKLLLQSTEAIEYDGRGFYELFGTVVLRRPHITSTARVGCEIALEVTSGRLLKRFWDAGYDSEP